MMSANNPEFRGSVLVAAVIVACVSTALLHQVFEYRPTWRNIQPYAVVGVCFFLLLHVILSFSLHGGFAVLRNDVVWVGISMALVWQLWDCFSWGGVLFASIAMPYLFQPIMEWLGALRER